MTILGTAAELPGTRHHTHDLIAAALPDRDPALISRKLGIETRYWTDEQPSVFGARALLEACDDAGLAPEALRRVIFVSSTSGDQLVPATSSLLLGEAGIADTCDAFDVNNACLGFLSGLDVAARSVATGIGPVAVVCAERFSRWISPRQHRSYLVFGDAAVAVVVGGGTGKVLGCHLSNRPAASAHLHHGVPGGDSSLITFGTSSREMTAMAVASLEHAARDVLDQASLSISDIDWVLPHQPNGSMLDRALAVLGVSPEQSVRHIEEVGSIGSAAIPFSLHRLRKTRPVRPGDRILMVGVGTGVARGAVLYEEAA